MKNLILIILFFANFIVFNGYAVVPNSKNEKTVIVMKKCVDLSHSSIRSKNVCPLVYVQDGILEVHVANYRGLFSVEILDEEQFVCDATTRNMDGNFIYVSPATFDKDHHYCVFVTVNGEKYVGEFDM